MVKCKYCGSVFYKNETTCSSCGAALPMAEQKEIKKTVVINLEENNSKDIRAKKGKKSLFLIVFLMFIFVNIMTSLFSEDEQSVPTPNYSSDDLSDVQTSKFTDSDLSKFGEMNEKFQSNPSDKEAVEYLVWYYVYNNDFSMAYEVTDIFLEQNVKDDGEIYILLANIYYEYNLYGYAYFVLDKGYELTQLDSVKNYVLNLNFENTQMENVLTMMFGKDLDLITYDDLASIKTLEIAEHGQKVFYSTEMPIFENGDIKNYDEFKENMKSISLNSAIYTEKNFDIFTDLQVLIDYDGGAVDFNSLTKLKDPYYFGLNMGYDTEKIPYMPNLNGLNLKGYHLKALGDLEKLTELEYFGLHGTEVFDISNIKNLPNIKGVTIYYNENITSLEDITNIPTLKKIVVEDMDITTFNINTDLVKLESLTLEDTLLRDANFISNCVDLEELRLIDNRDLPSIPNLNGLTNLEKLDIQTATNSQGYYNVDFISGLSNLKSLYIEGSIYDFNTIGTFSNLEELYIEGTTLPDNFYPLSSLENLKKLVIRGTPDSDVADFSFVSSLQNLTYLDLLECRYLETEAIFDLKNLENLYIDTFVGDFSGISNLKNLKYLYVPSLSIYSDMWVEYDGFITYVNAGEESYLKDYQSHLAELTNLEMLYIGSNALENIEFARTLTNLKKISLNDNYVTDLEPLSNLPNLEYINVVKNPISNWAGLKENKNIEIVEFEEE